jgi:hypothetical protein
MNPDDLTILSYCISIFNAQYVYDDDMVQKRIDELKEFIHGIESQ